MKKIIIALIFVVLLAGTVLALTSIGTKLSQKQLDEMDLSKTDLGEYYVKENPTMLKYECNLVGRCTFYVNISNSIKKEYAKSDKDSKLEFTNNYIVSSRTQKIIINLKEYKEIEQEHNLTYARELLYEELTAQKEVIVQQELNKIKTWKTPEEEYIDLVEGLEL